ncbi:MAG: dihydroneopterin aldolase [Prevotella sp.]|nr:dihydroneopterin aldolase [Prevotella sp.]
MKLVQSSIFLRRVRFYAYHGVLPQERFVGGEYVLDLKADYDVSNAMRTDDVADTLNYAAVFDVVRREMGVPSALLEHVVGRIGESLFREFPQIRSLDISLCKCNPPMGADSDGAGVEVRLVR